MLCNAKSHLISIIFELSPVQKKFYFLFDTFYKEHFKFKALSVKFVKPKIKFQIFLYSLGAKNLLLLLKLKEKQLAKTPLF